MPSAPQQGSPAGHGQAEGAYESNGPAAEPGHCSYCGAAYIAGMCTRPHPVQYREELDRLRQSRDQYREDLAKSREES